MELEYIYYLAPYVGDDELLSLLDKSQESAEVVLKFVFKMTTIIFMMTLTPVLFYCWRKLFQLYQKSKLKTKHKKNRPISRHKLTSGPPTCREVKSVIDLSINKY